MSLQLLAKQMEAKGREGDSMLVHMTPGEVAGLQSLAEAAGGTLTVNPETGLVEANFLKKLISSPMFAPLAGAGLMMIPGVGPMMAAGLVGGGTALATGDVGKGAMAGLGAYGGAGLAGGLMGAGNAAASQAATAANPTVMGPMPGAATGLQAAKTGAASLATETGRQAFMQGVGGVGGLAKTASMAAAPMLVEEPPKSAEVPVDDEMIQYDYDVGRTYAENTPSEGSYERKYFDGKYSEPRKIKARDYAYAAGGSTFQQKQAALQDTMAQKLADIKAKTAQRDLDAKARAKALQDKLKAEAETRAAERSAASAARAEERAARDARIAEANAKSVEQLTPAAGLPAPVAGLPALAAAPAEVPTMVEQAPRVAEAAPTGLPALVATPAPAPFVTPTVNLSGPTGALTNAPGALPTFLSNAMPLDAQRGSQNLSGASKSAFDYLMGGASTSGTRAGAAPATQPSAAATSPRTDQMYVFDPATGTFTKNPNYIDPEVVARQAREAAEAAAAAAAAKAETGGGNNYATPDSSGGSNPNPQAPAPVVDRINMDDPANPNRGNIDYGGYVPSQDPTNPSFVGPQDPFSQGGGSAGQSWESLPADMRGESSGGGGGGLGSLSSGSVSDALSNAGYADTGGYGEGAGGFGESGASFGGQDFGGGFDYGGGYDGSWAQGGLLGLAKGGMKSGGFVIPADVVSMVGEGNTDAGYSRIKAMVPGATAIKGKDGGQADTVKTSIEGKQPARVAHGEMYIPPETVKRMGGAKKLYAMMDRVRAQATGSKKQIRPVSLKKALA